MVKRIGLMVAMVVLATQAQGQFAPIAEGLTFWSPHGRPLGMPIFGDWNDNGTSDVAVQIQWVEEVEQDIPGTLYPPLSGVWIWEQDAEGPVYGDLNGDGRVGGRDWRILRDQLGGPGTADFNRDGIVDALDEQLWRELLEIDPETGTHRWRGSGGGWLLQEQATDMAGLCVSDRELGQDGVPEIWVKENVGGVTELKKALPMAGDWPAGELPLWLAPRQFVSDFGNAARFGWDVVPPASVSVRIEVADIQNPPVWTSGTVFLENPIVNGGDPLQWPSCSGGTWACSDTRTCTYTFPHDFGPNRYSGTLTSPAGTTNPVQFRRFNN